MQTREFVRSLKYDARPRTMDPIEQFNWVVALTIDTMHGAEFQYARCTQCNRTALGLRGMTTERPCRIERAD